MKELIVATAIKLNEHIYWGFRHDRIIEQHPKKFKTKDSIQGFVTNKERFLNRVEAMEFAYSNGQLKRQPLYKKEPLFSEDLW